MSDLLAPFPFYLLQDSAVRGLSSQEPLPHSAQEVMVTTVSSAQSPIVNTTPVTVTPSACVPVLVPEHDKRLSLDPQM